MPTIRHTSAVALRWMWLTAVLFLAALYLLSGLTVPPSPVATEPKNVSVASLMPSASSPDPLSELPADLRDVVVQLNQARANRLADLDLESADVADWTTICRRLSLSLVGTGMSMQEIRQLQSLPESERTARHLRNLLSSTRHHDYWAERYTRFLVGAEEGPFLVFRRRRFRHWLADQFASNRRYDGIVRDLITAEGLWTDRPEVNFYTVTYDSGDDGPDPIRLAARTSRVFLGLRIDCLQCHDDFLGNVSLGDADDLRFGTQQDFHQLAAFFTAARSNGLQGVRNGPVDYQYKYLDSDQEESVPAAVPFGEAWMPESGNPRRRLATWLTSSENRQAARSAVSHVWALLFGRARGESVDNLPLDEPMDAETKILVDDFIANGFDLRRLIAAIVMSDEFRVDSRAGFHVTARHDAAGAVFPLVRLRPEQIAGSVIQSSRVHTIDRDSSFLVQLQKFGGTNDFLKRYGDRGEDEFADDATTISQRLVMLNGKLVDESVDYNPVLNASAHVLMFSGEDDEIVRNAYWCVLNRPPDQEEIDHFVARLDATDYRRGAIEDLFWTLLNSSEFAWNH
ncbi:DUF1549 domain-containing protein [Crateriforma conspicua]|uniref:DUF1549 domain-containing protein n=1 Tax=Crateriforma conspicua TaxID=2527996 RepID=A0A5C6FX69_9PLAN|nr:DUF1549 domain-containing protein [Crateriforma conspicua]TWU67597.1 hypothetical protein V7x_31720 [Crateriforma conspicua]